MGLFDGLKAQRPPAQDRPGYEQPADTHDTSTVETEIDKGEGLPQGETGYDPLPVTMEGPTNITVRSPLPIRPVRPDRFITISIAVDGTMRQVLGDDANRYSVRLENTETIGGDDIEISYGPSGAVFPLAPFAVLELNHTAAIYARTDAANGATLAIAVEAYDNPVHYGKVQDVEVS